MARNIGTIIRDQQGHQVEAIILLQRMVSFPIKNLSGVLGAFKTYSHTFN
jgi:hypothetical protein